jgi:hypothetical protein
MEKGEMQTLDHPVFLMEGSYQRALHCFGVFLTRRDEIRALINYVLSEEEVEKGNKGTNDFCHTLLWQP